MKKEYTKLTVQKVDENGQPAGELEETIITDLIADEGKIFHCLTTGFTGGTRITLGSEDSEENYTEVDDPKYIEVIDAITEEASKK